MASTVLVRHCSAPQKQQKCEGSGQLASTPALVEDLLQVRIQEHSSGVQLLTDVTELAKGRIHFLEVLPGAVVSLWKQSEATGFVFTELSQARLQPPSYSKTPKQKEGVWKVKLKGLRVHPEGQTPVPPPHRPLLFYLLIRHADVYLIPLERTIGKSNKMKEVSRKIPKGSGVQEPELRRGILPCPFTSWLRSWEDSSE